MTSLDTTRALDDAAVTRALAMLDPAEIDAAREILARDGLITKDTQVAYFGLSEPDKNDLLDAAGEVPPRKFRAMLLDLATGDSKDAIVCPATGSVLSVVDLDPAVDGAVPVVLAEFGLVDDIVKADRRWVDAMRRRGLTDLSLLRAQALSAGPALDDNERGRRLHRVFTFVQKSPNDLPWAHPVDGVTAYVDVISHEVLDVVEYGDLGVPGEDGNFHDPDFNGPLRQGFRPIEVTQPEGPSFRIENGVVDWLGWRLQVGFDAREGLVLRNISIDDAGRRRPLIYRASIAEMVVPYGDPSPQRFFQNFFDSGEYLLGSYANSLELGCDCLGEITYLDVVLADNSGQPRTVPQAICIHEEDAGILWKHTDIFTGSSDTRRNRRLVVSFFVTVGNYDYGFYWYFYLDGKIELEVKATGVVFTSGHPGGSYPYASELAPGLGGPHHQHLFSARLDMMLDGPTNAVDELEIAPADDPGSAAITQRVTRLRTESEAQRLADNTRGRVWRVVNPRVQNRLGGNVGYALFPEGLPVLMAGSDTDIYRRATFATKHLWVTRYAVDEQYPAGDFVNQHPGGAGIPQWVLADRDVDGTDIVLWHTFGLTHFPRIEDWPIMPVDSTGFVLKPHGFFDRNPTLDVPPSTAGHCHPDEHQGNTS